MVPDWLWMLSIVALALAVLSAGAIAFDILAGRRQKMWVMNLVWPITALYFGPLGFWAYARMGRAPARAVGKGDGAERPFWQTAFIATSHCGAGCVVGDTVGEWGIFLAGLTLFGSKLLTAYAADFTLAYLLCIIFQFFTIAPMRKLGVRDGIVAALKADTISLVAFEVGMFAFMAVNRLLLFESPPEPNTATYWFLMQVAMIVGFATSYPANWWLVKSGVKEAM